MKEKGLRRNMATIVALIIMGAVAVICSAQVEVPKVTVEIITIDGFDNFRISWEPVEEVDLYRIYTSIEVNPESWGEPIATVGDSVLVYTEPVGDNRFKFFYVTAFTEPTYLVLVDGDRFYGNVTINPFYISKFQVTQAEYEAVMGVNPSIYQEGEDAPHRPVERVNWFNVIEYCNRLSIAEGLTPVYSYNDRTFPDDWYEQWPNWNTANANHTNVTANWEANGYRLPTEAEWHHAANGGIHPAPYTYSGSNSINDVAWYRDNTGAPNGTTQPVGSKQPNGLGIYDMSGNVYEWCWDIYQATPYPSGGDNPRGAAEGGNRTARGGCWSLNANTCVVTHRFTYGWATQMGDNLGFRVCRTSL